MSESGITLAQVLEIDADHMRAALDEYVQQHAANASLPASVLGFVAEELARAAGDALKLDVFGLVFKAWAAIRELHEYSDPARHPSGERAVVRWGKCTLKAPQTVDVKLGAGGVELPVLRLTVELAAEFNSLSLTIQDGAIRKMTPGTALASVGLKYGNTALITPRKTPALSFDRGIEFPQGLRIG